MMAMLMLWLRQVQFWRFTTWSTITDYKRYAPERYQLRPGVWNVCRRILWKLIQISDRHRVIGLNKIYNAIRDVFPPGVHGTDMNHNTIHIKSLKQLAIIVNFNAQETRIFKPALMTMKRIYNIVTYMNTVQFLNDDDTTTMVRHLRRAHYARFI